MRAAEKIKDKLVIEFAPEAIEVIDESHLHAGHAGAPGGGESHFKVKMVSEKFSGLSRVSMQRLVHQALSEELKSHIHALSLDLKAP